MQLLWTSKSQVLRLEEFPVYKKQSDEVIFFYVLIFLTYVKPLMFICENHLNDIGVS